MCISLKFQFVFLSSFNVYFSETFLLKDFPAEDAGSILAKQLYSWKGNWQMMAIIEEGPNCKILNLEI